MMLVCVAACSPDKKSLAEPSEAPGVNEDNNFQSTDSPLYIQLGTRWEMDHDAAFEVRPPYWVDGAPGTKCEIPRLATYPREIDCRFKIPEAKLFYSHLKFLVGTTMSESCPLLFFRPYYYKRSTGATFRPAGQDTDVDCTKNNPLCYGGAAPSLIPGFPKATGTYFNTNLLSQSTYLLHSENSTNWYGGHKVNYLAINDLANPTTPVTDGSPQTRLGGGNWRDYSIQCTNMWGEMMYRINYFIEDENVDPDDPTGNDDFEDWH